MRSEPLQNNSCTLIGCTVAKSSVGKVGGGCDHSGWRKPGLGHERVGIEKKLNECLDTVGAAFLFTSSTNPGEALSGKGWV